MRTPGDLEMIAGSLGWIFMTYFGTNNDHLEREAFGRKLRVGYVYI
jgi:hypothetical protein